ncbi:hypothetical protein H0X48_02820 [Candidatus Dependentiae bacterium]|nr:hypothetical protein [Candidatus Dependentiae bacterium]
MKKILFLVSYIVSIYALNAGVSSTTIVNTLEGLKEIESLKIGDKVVCLNNEFISEQRVIDSIEEIETNKIIEITTEDDTIIQVTPDQRFFIPYKWVQADQLCLGDVLLMKDRSCIKIKGICQKNETVKLYFISVKEHQNFLVSKNGIVIHNGPIGASVGVVVGAGATTFVFNGFYGAVGVGTSAIAGPVCGAAVAGTVRYYCLPVQLAATKTVGLFCGLWLGVATGPV